MMSREEARAKTDELKRTIARMTLAPREPEPKIMDSERNVYFIRDSVLGRIKIGVALRPEHRLRELSTMSPVPLAIIGIIRGCGLAVERELHVRFAQARLHGEWFEPVPELLAYIAENASRP